MFSEISMSKKMQIIIWKLFFKEKLHLEWLSDLGNFSSKSGILTKLLLGDITNA